NRQLGPSNGLPFQTYTLPWSSIVAESFLLQIGEPDPDEPQRLRWYDWQQVEDFDRSRSTDRHYMLDVETGQIRFGDHERGMAPLRVEGHPNIRVISLQLGGGRRGNVKQHQITRVVSQHKWASGISVTNPNDAVEGTDAETLVEAKYRVLQQLR